MPVIPESLFISGVIVKEEFVGLGGYGTVIKGELHGAAVALKLLTKVDHGHIDFCREALTWRSLNHKFVLPFLGIYEYRLAPSRAFLVSPHMKNGTLAQWRRIENPPTAEIEERILEVAHGVQYIHSEGMSHGDLRGANILLDDNLHVKIADFGLTRYCEATATKSGRKHPNFAAPELFGFAEDDVSDNTTRTQNSDIFAFGCVYYEIQFDTLPFADANEYQIMMLLIKGSRAPRLEVPPLSDEAWELIEHCWQEDKMKRPPIKDVVEKMMAWRNEPVLGSVKLDGKRKRRSPDSDSDTIANADELTIGGYDNHSLRRQRSRFSSEGSVPDNLDNQLEAKFANLFSLSPGAIDPALEPDYATLPQLRNSILICYTSPKASGTLAMTIPYLLTLQRLSERDSSQARFEAAVKFESSSPFINPSRVSPEMVVQGKNSIKLANTSSRWKVPAVCLTTGLLAESYLRIPTHSGYNKDHCVHQIRLNPIRGEFERAAAFIGTVFEVDKFACLLEQGCLSFVTRPKGAADNMPPRTSTSSRATSYPSSLGFNDQVPIYDARQQSEFNFSGSSLAALDQLPRFENDMEDPAGGEYICTVGYTVNSWTKTRNGPEEFCVTLNIQFVIILGKILDQSAKNVAA